MEKFLSFGKSLERIQTGLQVGFIPAVGSDRRLTKHGVEGNLKRVTRSSGSRETVGAQVASSASSSVAAGGGAFLSLKIGFVYFMEEGWMG